MMVNDFDWKRLPLRTPILDLDDNNFSCHQQGYCQNEKLRSPNLRATIRMKGEIRNLKSDRRKYQIKARIWKQRQI